MTSVQTSTAKRFEQGVIKCLVIDPFNKIRDIDAKTEDVNRYTMEYLTKIEIFVGFVPSKFIAVMTPLSTAFRLL